MPTYTPAFGPDGKLYIQQLDANGNVVATNGPVPLASIRAGSDQADFAAYKGSTPSADFVAIQAAIDAAR